MVSSVFFLSTSTGWVLLHCADDADVVADNVCFEVAVTVDSGKTWTVQHEKITNAVGRSQLEDGWGFFGRSWIDFADAQNGWEIFKIAAGSGPPSAGVMLRTVDGGKTWLPTKSLPSPGIFGFINSKVGWLVGDQIPDLFVTHDVGDSWRKVSAPVPEGIHTHLAGGYSVPMLEDGRRGYMLVKYSTGDSEGPYQSTAALFATADSGATWRFFRTDSPLPSFAATDVTHSVFIGLQSELEEIKHEGQCPTKRTALSLFRIGPKGSVSSRKANIFLNEGAVLQVSFISPEQGWAIISGRLFATDDGGATWVDMKVGGPWPDIQGICVPFEPYPPSPDLK